MANLLNTLIKKINKEDDGRTLRGYISSALEEVSNKIYGIEEGYKNVIINNGNSNNEIVDSRTDTSNGITYDTLRERLEAMQNQIKSIPTKQDIIDEIYPVGIEIFLASYINPNDKWGGIWVRTAKGQMIVGVNENDTDFKSAGKTGGEKAHTITIDEMPSHYHGQVVTAGSGGSATRNDYVTDGKGQKYSQGVNTNATGGGKAHNNMPPYITAYIWKRVG